LLVEGYQALGKPIPRVIKDEHDVLATAEAVERMAAWDRHLKEQFNWKPDE
jgi:hypothetical protein